MTIRRRATVMGAAVLSLAALSACGTKPTPVATVGANRDTVHSEAACYGHGKALPAGDVQTCAKKDMKTVKVVEGNKVRFGVDKKIADKGWYLMVGQQRTDVYKRTYVTFDAESLFQRDTQTGARPKAVEVRIVESPDGNSMTGLWNFTVKLQDKPNT